MSIQPTISKPKPQPRKKSTTQPNSNIGRSISLSGPLDEIRDRMGNQVGNIYIVSCHGCRTGSSFDVIKNISVVTTSRHQYKASGPTGVMGNDIFGNRTYLVIEPTMAIGENIIGQPRTIRGVVESIRNSIVPKVDPATKNHALSKGTRAVIKMRDGDSQLMTIPESRLFVPGKKISGYEGVFIVEPGNVVRDVTDEFGLRKREDTDRTSNLLRQTRHPQYDVINNIIECLERQLEHYREVIESGVSITEEQRRYIESKNIDIQMLTIELENKNVLGKYFMKDAVTNQEREVLFSDIANHPVIQDRDVIILHVCNGICDERTSFLHGESRDVRKAKLSAIQRTRSSDAGQDNVLTGLIFRDDTPYSESEMSGGNSKLKTKTKRNIKRKKYKRLTVKRRALRRKFRRSRNRSYRKSYRI
jgi:hypothetical protein